jgi:transcriptional regulator with XRE-family HTH domain
VEGVIGDLQTTIGHNLRRHRETLGLSQEQFAELLGVHRTYMGAVERGERNMTLQTVERLAEQLHLDALSLMEAPLARPVHTPRRAGRRSA